MNFLYPENALFGVVIFFILLINKKIPFTHLEFFKSKKFFTIPILDILILISLTLLIMYPVTTKTKKVYFYKSYSFNPKTNKKHIILILDVSLSMKDYFEDEKNDAISTVFQNKGNYIMLVVFEGDYKIVRNFTTDTSSLLLAINSLKLNMVTNIGGSMLKDTVAGIINSFKFLNPTIYIFSDGGAYDDSSVSLDDLKNISKGLKIYYKPYGNDPLNDKYLSIFKAALIDSNNFNPYETIQTSFSTTKKISKEIKYKTFDNRFIYLALFLLMIKILKVRFENRFNFF